MTQTAVNPDDQPEYDLPVPASQLGTPPAGADYLVAVADPLGAITEMNDSDTTKSLSAAPDDILANSVNASVNPNVPYEIDANFMPAGRALNLAQAEALCGVDHFNWLQYIEQIPENWQFEILTFPPVGTEGIVSAVTVFPPIIDPIVETDVLSQNKMYAIGFNGGGQFSPNSTTWPANTSAVANAASDDEVYFWNEDISQQNIASHTTTYAVNFDDKPYVPASAMPPGGSEQFETSLVGVSPNGSPKIWGGLGFTWSTNAVNVGSEKYPVILGNVQISSTFPSAFATPSTIEGGILNIRPDDETPALLTPPALVSIADQTVNPGGTVSLAAAATDVTPGAALVFSLDPAPDRCDN